MAKLIGTAGHVDHGKTTLIRALTGIDADRLPEEKQRGMTIDVGFAFIDLPDHGRVSIVDVPGHERFLTNMLVGALGIDVALLCVSADESVMPQTREHLQILTLLPVDQLVVALTRADLADSDLRELVRADVEELLAETRFREVPILAVSAHTGEGLPELRAALSEALNQATPAPDESLPWYLPIDRVFTVKGHGCVVTGTLAQGTLRVGDEAILEPGGDRVRVRQLHIHGQEAPESEKGRRTAVNLGGVKEEDVHRGMALGAPGALFETRIIDARMTWTDGPRHGSRIRVSVGAEEAVGKLFLSDQDSDLAQLRLDAPVAVAVGQPLILRRYSPPTLIGGGRVLVPQAKLRRKGEAPRLVEAADLPSAVLAAIGVGPNGTSTEEICRILGKSPQALGEVFEDLKSEGSVLGFAGQWLSREGLEVGSAAFLAALGELHEKNPTSAWLARERVLQAAGLAWTGKPLDRLVAHLAQTGAIVANGTQVRLEEFRIQLSDKQRSLLNRVIEVLEVEPVNVPAPNDIAKAVHAPIQAIDEILKLGTQAGEIISVGEGIFYSAAQLGRLKERIREIAAGKPFAASDIRDALGTSRRYVIPLLEYLDAQRFTMRRGDHRVIE